MTALLVQMVFGLRLILSPAPMICREPRYVAQRIERIGAPSYWLCMRAPRVPKETR